MLPIASLEEPLTAARVESLKRQGKDWFRTLLLPEALTKRSPPLPRFGKAEADWPCSMDAFVDAAGGNRSCAPWNPGNRCRDCVRSEHHF